MLKMTLYGMNDYLDDTLFDFLPDVLPAGTFDAGLMKEILILECGDLFPYYQVPQYAKMHMRNFFLRNKDQFRRVWEALNSEYNPIENYDRIEAWSDSHSESLSTSASESVSAITSSSDSQSSSSRGDVSAYNASTLQPQSASAGNAASSGRTSNNTSGTQNSLKSAQALDAHRGRVHGNIGVTSSQQLIQASIDLGSYDIYLWVVRLFEKNCISAIV